MTMRKTLPLEEVRRVAQRALENAGCSPRNADLQSNLWLEAELRGHPSHGLLRLPRIVARIKNGVVDPNAEGDAEWRKTGHLSVDGRNGLGPVVALRAIDLIAERARTAGIAVATIHNSNHLGMLAVYAEQVARDGQVLIALTTSEALVHPWGGRRAMLGTNPIAIGVPSSPEPFVLDMATSVISMGKVHDYAARNEPLESGWALDGQGNPTTIAADARTGALAPFGGAKGYGLGLAFEVVVGALTASALGSDVKGTLDSTEICNKGDVFIVIEPGDGSRFSAVSAYLEQIRNSAPSTAEAPITVPGDRSRSNRQRHIARGIPIETQLWQTLCDLASAGATVRGNTP